MHRFMSNYFESGLGFKLRYESTTTALMTTNQTGQCGGIFFTPNGTFTSPSFPNNYPDNVDCIYTVSLPMGAIISLSTEMFDVEDDSECNYDWLEIKDGSSENSPTVGKFCGTNMPTLLQSTQNNMWIR